MDQLTTIRQEAAVSVELKAFIDEVVVPALVDKLLKDSLPSDHEFDRPPQLAEEVIQ